MEPINLKEKAKLGLLWSAIDRFSGQAIQFILGIILARLLDPSDFGLIGMLAIFMAVSEAIIDSGFGNALIQKKDRNQEDYSTVFYFNSIVGVVLYIIMFISAPIIAQFYELPILTDVTRVLSLNLIINSFMIVQNVRLTIELNFRLQTKIRVTSNLVAGSIAVYLAYNGYGVWSLVLQTVLAQFFICILLWLVAKWRPSLSFSKRSFQRLFAFGSNLLITGLYGPIFNNLNTLIIGKAYSPISLGYYTRAYHFAQFPSFNISQIISRVSFPILSSIQDDDIRLRNAYRQLIKNTYFIVFPMMIGLAIVAESLVRLLLSDKWIECVALLQILSLSLAFYPICSYNINLLLVKGKSGLHLRLDLIKKAFSIVVLIITITFGIKAICYGMIASALFSWVVTAYYSGRLINLTLYRQIKDILPSFLSSAVMALVLSPITILDIPEILKISIQLLLGIIIYLTLSNIINKECMVGLINKIKSWN